MQEWKRFEDCLGQDQVKEELSLAIQADRLPHALILAGDRGSGKHDIACAAATALMCENLTFAGHVPVPCGKCRSCLQAKGKSHPDIIEAVHKKKDGNDRRTALGVDDVRSLREAVAIKPYERDKKVFILPASDQMTPQAQNALLKTLEEPPAYAHFLLLARGTQGFLPTILSRSVVMRLKPVDRDTLSAYLQEKMGLSSDRAYLFAGLAHGNAMEARRYAEDEALQKLVTKTLRLFRNLENANAFDISSYAEDLTGTKEEGEAPDPSYFYDFAEDWLHDLVVLKSGGRARDLIFGEEVQYSSEIAQTVDFPRLEQAFETLADVRRRRQFQGNDAQLTELLLLELRGILRKARRERGR